jgi:6-phosphofructo-2-kinase
MRKIFPREYEARAGDKLHYRYPGVGGESYLDLIMRLQEVRDATREKASP